MENNETIQDRIKYLLAKEELNSSSLAKKLGVSDQTIRNVVYGRNNPGYEIIIGIINLFDWVTADWLLMGYENSSSNKDVNKLYSIIDKQHHTIDKQHETINMLTRRLIKDIEANEKTQKIV